MAPPAAAPLQGLSSLYGPAGPQAESTGRDPQEWGRPADPRHRIPGDSSHNRPYEQRVYGGEIATDDEVASTPLPGLVVDTTPDVHAAPFPAGATQDPLIAAEQMRLLHGEDLGGVIPTFAVGTPYATTVDSARHDSPNQTDLAAGVPNQLRSGSDDTEQGYGKENGFGFQFGRQFRRWFKDPIPLDRTGTVPRERPFRGRHPLDQHSYDVDSQFGVSGDTSVNMGMRDTPTGYPTPYEQPANPTYRPTVDYSGDGAFSGGWVAG